MVLNTGTLGWESSTLTTRPLIVSVRHLIARQLIASIGTGQRCNQSASNIIMVLLGKIVSNVNLKDAKHSCKRLILDTWLDLGCTSAY